jgi:hypothetical protein
MLEPPPAMVALLEKKVIFFYAGAVRNYLLGVKDRTSQQEELLLQLKIMNEHKFSFNEDKFISVPLDLTGWKPMKPEFAKKISLLPNDFQCKLTREPNVNGDIGSFNFVKRLITLRLNPEINSNPIFQLRLNSIQSTIKHELQHVSQLLLFYLIDNGKLHGLPSDKIKGQLEKEKPPEGLSHVEQHALMDAEFFTNLRDQIEDFIRVIKKGKQNSRYKQLLAKSWLGLSDEFFSLLSQKILGDTSFTPENRALRIKKLERLAEPRGFFRVLQKHAPDKYRKACSIFWDKVSEHF